MGVLRGHAAVLADPEPLVLVEGLGAATVNLRFLFWVDVRRHSLGKVKSAVIRLTKRAYQDAGISMPDDQREVVFPQGVPVQLLREKAEPPAGELPAPRKAPPPPAQPADKDQANASEGGLASEEGEIKQQARRSPLPGAGRNLLEDEGD
jgi:small conductance mechanosensitive channel